MLKMFNGHLVFVVFLATLLVSRLAAQASSSGTPSILRGTVVDPLGAVLAHAKVLATDQSTGQAYFVKTANDGSYRFGALTPGKYTVRFEVQGFKTEIKTVVVGSIEDTELNVRLDVRTDLRIDNPYNAPPIELEMAPDSDWGPLGPPVVAMIAGEVRNRKGEPIPRVQVTLVQEHAGSRYQVATQCTGLYRLSEIEPGRYKVRFEAKGFRTETRARMHMDAGRITRLDTTLKPIHGIPQIQSPCASQPSGSVVGTVTKASGAGMPGTQVTIREPYTGRFYQLTTDVFGQFWLPSVAPGRYTVCFEASGFKTDIRTLLVNPMQVTQLDVRLSVKG